MAEIPVTVLPGPNTRPSHPSPFQRTGLYRKLLTELPAPVLDTIRKIMIQLEKDALKKRSPSLEHMGFGVSRPSFPEPLGIQRGAPGQVQIPDESEAMEFLTTPFDPETRLFTVHPHSDIMRNAETKELFENPLHEFFSPSDLQFMEHPQLPNRFNTEHFKFKGRALPEVSPGDPTIRSYRPKYPGRNRRELVENLFPEGRWLDELDYGIPITSDPTAIAKRWEDLAKDDWFDYTIFE